VFLFCKNFTGPPVAAIPGAGLSGWRPRQAKQIRREYTKSSFEIYVFVREFRVVRCLLLLLCLVIYDNPGVNARIKPKNRINTPNNTEHYELSFEIYIFVRSSRGGAVIPP
jgi:hypothetical protein